ncbi:MAG: autotransporter outer membrane beta-barrel domain-containing protein [Thiobacillus sp.]
MLGDWGRNDHGSRDGSTGLAELGGGYNFGPAQINVSAGQTWSGQNLPNNGDVDYTGNYLMVEGIIPVSPARGLFATIGAYGHWGEADIRRGYLVASTQNFSTGSPDTETLGLRARLDWENAFAWSGSQLSPYADLSYAESRMDGYTETGGAFPAQFNKRKDHATDLRVGVNAAKPIPSTRFQLIGKLEVAHRFEDSAAATSGNINGLFAFDLAGEKFRQTWMKAGVGVEGQVGQGKASVMLNATTKGEMPNAWLAASYQLTF